MLEDGRGEFQSITEARSELLELKEQVQDAQHRLSTTQDRVDQTVSKLTELKKEAAEMSRLNELSSQQMAEAARSSRHPEAAEILRMDDVSHFTSAFPETATPVAPVSVPTRTSPRPAALQQTAPAVAGAQCKPASKGLESTMTLEPGLKNFWYVCGFHCMSSSLLFSCIYHTPCCYWQENHRVNASCMPHPRKQPACYVQVCDCLYFEVERGYAGTSGAIWRAVGAVPR